MKQNKCPYCDCEEFYVKQRYSGTCIFRFRADGKEVENGDMHDNARYKDRSKYIYCNNCNKKVCKIDEFANIKGLASEQS